jgi:hypothetical protein
MHTPLLQLNGSGTPTPTAYLVPSTSHAALLQIPSEQRLPKPHCASELQELHGPGAPVNFQVPLEHAT